MNQETLKATVQYQDYEGTAAADHHDRRFLSEFAAEHGIDTNRYFIIGVKINIGERRDDDLAHTYVDLLAVDSQLTRAGGIDFVKEYAVNNDGVLPYQTFSIEASLEDVLLYFKRFEIVLFSKLLQDFKFRNTDND